MKYLVTLIMLVAVSTLVGCSGQSLYGVHTTPGKHTTQTPNKQAPDKRASFSARCPYTGEKGNIDPILFPGVPSPHTHEFFGAVGVTENTTSADLRNGQTTCSGVPNPEDRSLTIADRSAYWVPKLYTTPDKISGPHPIATVYWRSIETNPRKIIDMPQDLAYVAGNARAMTGADNPHVYWSCIAAKTVGAPHLDAIPATCPAYYDVKGQQRQGQLRATIRFPSCYDGGGTPPNFTSHLTYPVANKGYPQYPYKTTCPLGYAAIPELDIVFRYLLGDFPLDDQGTTDPYDDVRLLDGATLASDDMDMGGGMTTGIHGVTLHADAMLGFTQADINQLNSECFHEPLGPRNCGIVGGQGVAR